MNEITNCIRNAYNYEMLKKWVERAVKKIGEKFTDLQTSTPL